MAAVDTRLNKQGEIISHRVRWRFRGTPQVLTLNDADMATRMKKAIEARNHDIPKTHPDILDLSIITGIKQVAPSGPLFDEVAESYIAGRARASAETKDRYRQMVRNELSALCGEAMEWITTDVVQRLLNDMADSGRSPVMTYELACSIFKFAVNRGILRNGNPCALVELPTWDSLVAVFLTPAEAGITLDACEEVGGQPLRDLTDGILGTGMRISEALGLIVDDVHVEDVMDAWIDVSYQLSRAKLSEEPVRKRTKTKRGRRRIALDTDTACLFARVIEGKRPQEPVFADPERGGWWRQSYVQRLWADVRDVAYDAGMIKRPRIHDLRHTHAAWLLTDAVPMLAVSRRLGHTSITITADTYGHILPDGDDAIRASLVARRGQMADRPASPKPTSGPRTRGGDTTSPPRKTATSRRGTTSRKVASRGGAGRVPH